MSAQGNADGAPVSDAMSAKLGQRRADMASRMPYRPARCQSHSAAAVAFRCHQLHGESAQTWEQRISGDFKRLALIIGTMRMMGALELLTEKMMPVELALGPGYQPEKALHREATTDAEEDVLQAAYVEKPCEQTARALLRKRATMRAASLDHDREIAARHGLNL
jgi:hypothetical protein